jgi:hypothetical protein
VGRHALDRCRRRALAARAIVGARIARPFAPYKKKGGTRCPLDIAVAKNATYRFLAVFLAAFFAAFFAFLAMCYPPLQGGFENLRC